jgi:hypothetical protein
MTVIGTHNIDGPPLAAGADQNSEIPVVLRPAVPIGLVCEPVTGDVPLEPGSGESQGTHSRSADLHRNRRFPPLDGTSSSF